jgi:hypothetical protein
MLAASGNVLVGLSMLAYVDNSDLLAFVASDRLFQDVHLAATALQISRLHFTAGDLRGANRYASVASAIAAIVGSDHVVEEAEDLCRKTAFVVCEPEPATHPPLL